MKLEIEIINDKVEYKYWFSETNKGGGSMPLAQDLLATFVNATHYLQNHYRHENEKLVDGYINDAKCRAWIEKNPVDFVDMLDRISQEEPKKKK